jgi:hypothetical protein
MPSVPANHSLPARAWRYGSSSSARSTACDQVSSYAALRIFCRRDQRCASEGSSAGSLIAATKSSRRRLLDSTSCRNSGRRGSAWASSQRASVKRLKPLSLAS